MGTRSLICVASEGKLKVAQYCQWDGYPGGQGEDIVKFIRKKMDKKLFKERVDALKELTVDEVKECWKKCGAGDSEWVSCDVSDVLRETYPQLSRDTGSDVLEMIQNGSVVAVHNSASFAKDSLFCEWAYVIDLDSDVLEVYSGFNKAPISESERFYSDTPDDGGYFPIKLFKRIKFSDLTAKTMDKIQKECNDAQ